MAKEISGGGSVRRAVQPGTIRFVVLQYMKKAGCATFGEIYEGVRRTVKIDSKTPRNSVFSVVSRMSELERVEKGTYKLKRKGSNE